MTPSISTQLHRTATLVRFLEPYSSSPPVFRQLFVIRSITRIYAHVSRKVPLLLFTYRHRRQTRKAESARGGRSYINNPTADKWSTIIDRDRDALAVFFVSNSHLRAAW